MIPSKFFGLQADTVDFYYGARNIIENVTDEEFIINIGQKRKR